MTIFIIYENKHGRDEAVLFCATNEIAERECDKLDKRFPRSDGFYINQSDVITE